MKGIIFLRSSTFLGKIGCPLGYLMSNETEISGCSFFLPLSKFILLQHSSVLYVYRIQTSLGRMLHQSFIVISLSKVHPSSLTYQYGISIIIFLLLCTYVDLLCLRNHKILMVPFFLL